MSLCCTLCGLLGLLSRQKAKETAKWPKDHVGIIAGLQKIYNKLEEDNTCYYYLETQFLLF